MNKHEALDKLVKKMKVPDMIVSTLFLVTGVYLAMNSGSIGVGNWFWVKLVGVFLSIPLAVVGFKKKNKMLALLSVLLILYTYGISETKSASMKKAQYLEALGADVQVSEEALKPNLSSPTYDAVAHGAAIFTKYCQHCHGADGKLGKSGAKDLSASIKSKDETLALIRKGKNSMPGFKGFLDEDQILAVNAYLHTQFIKTNNAAAGH
jgi:mono/diheme cytochrome c family protein